MVIVVTMMKLLGLSDFGINEFYCITYCFFPLMLGFEDGFLCILVM